MATIKEIAKTAGVSIGTVSNVLNGLADGARGRSGARSEGYRSNSVTSLPCWEGRYVKIKPT